MIGEDTVLGNLDFVLDSEDKRLYGAGIILYPQNWNGSINGMQETTRSGDDFRLLSMIKLKGSPLFGYHGSHFIVRSNVEDGLGWDYDTCRAEDWLFSIKLVESYGNVASPMKGFAYEKPPFTIKDHFKQRRRWMCGVYDIIKRKDVPLKYKIPAAYGAASWYSALPSVLAAGPSIINPTGGLFLGAGALSGFIWYSIYDSCRTGYKLLGEYIEKHDTLAEKAKLIFKSSSGLFIETLCPWYALIKKTKNFDCIEKDKK